MDEVHAVLHLEHPPHHVAGINAWMLSDLRTQPFVSHAAVWWVHTLEEVISGKVDGAVICRECLESVLPSVLWWDRSIPREKP
jgi:hypothetical protein